MGPDRTLNARHSSLKWMRDRDDLLGTPTKTVVRVAGSPCVGDSVQEPGRVVRDDEAAVRGDDNARGSTRARTTAILESRDEVRRAHRRAILEVDSEDLRRSGRLTVPRAM